MTTKASAVLAGVRAGFESEKVAEVGSSVVHDGPFSLPNAESSRDLARANAFPVKWSPGWVMAPRTHRCVFGKAHL